MPNAERVGVTVGGSRVAEEESLTAEIARVEAVLAERRYELTSNRGAVRVVGRTLVRAAHAAAQALLGAAERPARTADGTRRPRRRSAP
jgi:hypothetical protein